MQAVVLSAYGGIEQLKYEQAERPEPTEGEVLVKVFATSINPIDYKLRSGALRAAWPLDFPFILGRDLAGEIVSLGPGVSGFAIGQRVMALANHTYAEYAAVKAADLAEIPSALSFEQAAAIPLVALTGAQLAELGIKAHRGQSVMVTGAVGGVGRAAIYVARQHQAQVIAVVRPTQMDEAESLGTLAVVSLDNEEGLARFQHIDALADTIGGAVAARLFPCLRHGAAYATVVELPEEARSYPIHTVRIMAQPDALRLGQLATALAENRWQLPIARVMPLSEIREAHRLAEAGGLAGKIILLP